MREIPLLLNHNPNHIIGRIQLTDEGISLFSTQPNICLAVGGIVLESEDKDDNTIVVNKLKIMEIRVVAIPE
jgi:hypothetical protein